MSQLKSFEFATFPINSDKTVYTEKHSAQYYTEELSDDAILEMVAIPGGDFAMGETIFPYQQTVTAPSFFMGKYPITQRQWRVIASRQDLIVKQTLEPNPAHFRNCSDSDNRPVEQVSWYDAVEFCARLSKLTNRGYRLPSEIEWEYACKAGTNTPFYFGEKITEELVNHDSADHFFSGREQTTPVGQFPPNSFGLYDMHGNVWEWCNDIHRDNITFHSLRGGSWLSRAKYCRSSYRESSNGCYYSIGFRVVCSAL